MNHHNTRSARTDSACLLYPSPPSETLTENQLGQSSGERLLHKLEEPFDRKEDSQDSLLSQIDVKQMTAPKKKEWAVPDIPAPNLTYNRHREVQVEHEWEGVVLSKGINEFQARLIELSNVNHVEEIAEFDLDIVSDSDLPLLREGAIFRWIIGRSRSPDGTIELLSKMVFRRLPQWRRHDLTKIRKQAESDFEKIEFIPNEPDEA